MKSPSAMNKPFANMLLLAMVLAACNGGGPAQQTAAPDSTPPGQQSGKEVTMKIDSRLEPYVERATSDLADRLEIDESEIELVEARLVTWPNGALGCPDPDMLYTQALVDGYRIRLAADGRTHHYHGAQDGPPFHCPADRVGAPAAGSRQAGAIRQNNR